MRKRVGSGRWGVALVTLVVSIAAHAQLKEVPEENATSSYLDGGVAPSGGRIVRVEKWACPAGAVRPSNGVVTMTVANALVVQPSVVTLLPRQCLLRQINPETGVSVDSLVDMVNQGDAGGYVVVTSPGSTATTAQTGTSSNGISTKDAASAANSSAGGFYASCTPNPFELCSGPMPNPKTDRARFNCFNFVCPFGR